MKALGSEKESISLRHRIEECDQAAALVSPGVMQLNKRELSLNLKRMHKGKHTLPLKMLMEVTSRHSSDLTQELVEQDVSNAATMVNVQELISQLAFWHSFDQADDSEKSSFDLLQPTFPALVDYMYDWFQPVNHPEETTEDLQSKLSSSVEVGFFVEVKILSLFFFTC